MRDTVRPRRLRVQGIRHTVDDIILRGERVRAVLTDAVLTGSQLTRTIEGASTVTIPLHDPDGELRRHKLFERRVDITLDGLFFRLVALNREGSTLTLTFEDRDVARQRIAPGATKAYRDKMTRAEFYLSELREVPGDPIPLYSPELHTVQPIENARQGKEAQLDVNEQRGKGLDKGAKLTVKGVLANATQLDAGDRVLRVGESLGAPREAMCAAICAGTQENNMIPNTNDGFFALLDSTEQMFGVDAHDLEACAKIAYTKGFWHAGLIESVKKGLSPGDAAQQMEGSAYPDLYAQWEKQGYEWVDAYQGGSFSGTLTETVEVRYAFERGKKETIWDNGAALAEEVNWRRFVSNGITYFIAETDLLASKVRMRIDDDTDGVDAVSFDYDVGKKLDEATITCRVDKWAAPPGSVVILGDQGPADGRYIVSTIETDLDIRDADSIKAASITVKRPQKPLPEPAPETRTKTTQVDFGSGGRGGAGSGAGARLAGWAQKQVGVTEGDATQRKWAAAAGLSYSTAWCGIFVAYGLRTACGIDPPSGYPDVTVWLGFGSSVSKNDIRDGDLLLYDWGDGGDQDHIAIAVDGMRIGGNQSGAGGGQVTKADRMDGNIIAVRRI